MSIQVRQQLDITAINAQLGGSGGAVMRDMLRRAWNVQRMAKSLAPVGQGQSYGGPLKNSIMVATKPGFFGGLSVIVGSTVKYAFWVHEGTGIYGQYGTPIVPKTASVLRFVGKDKKIHFAPSVKGQEGTKYLSKALDLAFKP